MTEQKQVEAKSVAVTVESPIIVAQANKVKELGADVIKAIGQASAKYYALIVYVRKEKVDSKIVARELSALGFKRTRISEINRIANADPAVYSAFEAKTIGMKAAVLLARVTDDGKEKKPEATVAATVLQSAGVLNTQEAAEGVKRDYQEATAPRDTKSIADKMKAHARALAMLASRNKEWTFPDSSYKVIVEKLPVMKSGIAAQ